MPISWNEIRDRSLRFSKEWAAAESEDADAKSFWDGFFEVFGVPRRRVATFEHRVKKIDGKDGFIDLLWKGVLLIEHKSRGKDLDRAKKQALEYFPNLKDRDLPRYVLVSDFARFRLHDLEENEHHEFVLKDLHKNVKLFGFMAGYQVQKVKPEDPANVKAAELMGNIHDQLKAVGYEGHALEVYLVRLLFCLFSDDTSIFEKNQFQDYINTRTADDGTDLGDRLGTLFHVLNTPDDKRLRNLDDQLAAFPYVNGKLFQEGLPPASFDTAMRQALLDCAGIDWSRISPAIFGSLFQSVMDSKARRNLGAHYTRETNILRLIKPLFLDALWEDFEKSKKSREKLTALHDRLARLRFLDPACGCGNFLVITYREIRLLELEILRALYADRGATFLDVEHILKIDVDQFYGIEVEEFPAQIAQVALWLTDHQMNMRISVEFGQYFRRLPLRKAANIVNANALRIDWRDVVKPTALSYILGNPPFVGHQWRTADQMQDMDMIWGTDGRFGRLDYVACWYRKAADYLADNHEIRAAFVSTNSITQGEQVGTLWPNLLQRGVKIHFAHRTFQWSSEARGKAAVHCVIIGFALCEPAKRILFDYESPQAEPQALAVARISPYLVDAPNVILPSRTSPPLGLPQLIKGSQPTDGGHLILTTPERDVLLATEPQAEPWLRPFIGGEELINGNPRWCLWLKNISPSELKKMPRVMARVEAVAAARRSSPTKSVREYADKPTLFTQDRQPDSDYLAIPEVSSENRRFIPIGFLPRNVIASNKLQILTGGTIYHFGILSSTMHNAWMRYTCGRLESRYSYAPSVYNNFPWPILNDKQRASINTAAQNVLDARAIFSNCTLGDLYDPITMPPELVRAHAELDRVVDAAYGKSSFVNELARITLLFELYQNIIDPLNVAPIRKKGGRRNFE